MPLVNTRELLKDAQKGGYAVGAFNIENMEMAQAVVQAAEEENAPVILQTTPSTVRYANTAIYAAIIRSLAQQASVNVALHLDHGSSFELCRQAADDGYTSIMIDGSKLELRENISLAGRVVEMAKGFSEYPAVEAELGKLGGKEDDVEVEDGADIYTSPDEALQFVKQTGVDSLAVAIGTAHGFYQGEPKLDFERLAQIHAAVNIPLVLHGTSGVSDEDVKRAIGLGICKVNFATELRCAYTDAVRLNLLGDSNAYDPKQYGAAGRSAVVQLVRHRIKVCAGK